MENYNTFQSGQKSQTVLLTTEQTAKYLGISPATLNTWRCTKRNIVPYIKLGGKHVRYRQADLEAYINAHLIAG